MARSYMENGDLPFYTKEYEAAEHPGILDSAVNGLPAEIMAMNLNLEKGMSGNGSMKFRCPCPGCKGKLGLYSPKGGSTAYTIRNFSGCGHYGYNGQYPNDVIGLRMGARGLPNTRANAATIMRDSPTYNEAQWESEEKKKKRNEERIRKTLINIDKVTAATSWGSTMPDDALDLLDQFRGISRDDLKNLPPTMFDSFGFCKNAKVLKTGEDGYYYVTGFMFRLSENEDGTRSLQARRVKKDMSMFVQKDDKKDNQRFFSMGPTTPFNIEMLDYANGLEPIFVTEGPMDAIVTAIALKSKAQVISIQGCQNGSYLQQELKNRGGKVGIFLSLDDDESGRSAQIVEYRKLKTLPNVEILPFPGYLGKKDMNDLWLVDKELAADWMQMIRGVGRRILDGRLLPEDGKTLLSRMKMMNSINDFKLSGRAKLVAECRQMCEKVASMPEKKREEEEATRRADVSKAIHTISGITKENREK